jgi:hypothetical protein
MTRINQALVDWEDLVICKAERNVGASYLVARALVEHYLEVQTGTVVTVVGRTERLSSPHTRGSVLYYAKKMLGFIPDFWKHESCNSRDLCLGERLHAIVFDDFDCHDEHEEGWKAAGDATNTRIAIGGYNKQIAYLVENGVSSTLLPKVVGGASKF